MANIANLFFNAAANKPNRVAIIGKEQRITYGLLQQEVKETASYFIKRGIGKGDRVMVFVPMGIDLYRVVLALFQIGAVAVFLDEWVNKSRMEQCCRIAQCKGFIAAWKIRLLTIISSEVRAIPIKLSPGMRNKISHPMVVDVTDEDEALITFTTGTTGIPKAAKRTHGFLRAQFEALIPIMQEVETSVEMPMLPIVLFLNLGLGKISVIADFKTSKPHTFNPAVIYKQIQQHKVQRLISSPWYALQLARYIKSNHLTETSLNHVISGGASVLPDEASLLSAAFPKARLSIVYGSTEAEPISVADGRELMQQNALMTLGTLQGLWVGAPHKSTAVMVIPFTNGPVVFNNESNWFSSECKEAEPGEICVSGAHVLKHYVANEEAEKLNKIWIGNTVWHRTGDAGYMKNGSIYLLGRCKQIIRWNGQVFYPFSTEYLIKQYSGCMGGIFLKDGNPVLVVETKGNNKNAQWQKDLASAYPVYLNIPVVCIPVIPKDKRHHSRIDYEMLEQVILNNSKH